MKLEVSDIVEEVYLEGLLRECASAIEIVLIQPPVYRRCFLLSSILPFEHREGRLPSGQAPSAPCSSFDIIIGRKQVYKRAAN